MTIKDLRFKLNKKSPAQLKVCCAKYFKGKDRLVDALNDLDLQVDESMTTLKICEKYKEDIIDYICEELADA